MEQTSASHRKWRKHFRQWAFRQWLMFPLWSAFDLNRVHWQIKAWNISWEQRMPCCTASFDKQIYKCFYIMLILGQGESGHLVKGKRAQKLNEKTWAINRWCLEPHANVKVNVPLTVTLRIMWNLSSACQSAFSERAVAIRNHWAPFLSFLNCLYYLVRTGLTLLPSSVRLDGLPFEPERPYHL